VPQSRSHKHLPIWWNGSRNPQQPPMIVAVESIQSTNSGSRGWFIHTMKLLFRHSFYHQQLFVFVPAVAMSYSFIKLSTNLEKVSMIVQNKEAQLRMRRSGWLLLVSSSPLALDRIDVRQSGGDAFVQPKQKVAYNETQGRGIWLVGKLHVLRYTASTAWFFSCTHFQEVRCPQSILWQ